MNDYLEAREISPKVRVEIRDFFSNTRRSKENFLKHETEILEELLAMLIAIAVSDQVLGEMLFFVGCEPNFLMEIGVSLQMVCYFSVRRCCKARRHMGNEMFSIIREAVEVLINDRRLSILGENKYFGEVAILNSDCKRIATRCAPQCICGSDALSRHKFIKAIKNYPAMEKKCQEYARARREDATKLVSSVESPDDPAKATTSLFTVEKKKVLGTQEASKKKILV